jgi:hypothetical protein
VGRCVGFPNEAATLKCLYLVTGRLTRPGEACWMNRWKPALNAFAIHSIAEWQRRVLDRFAHREHGPIGAGQVRNAARPARSSRSGTRWSTQRPIRPPPSPVLRERRKADPLSPTRRHTIRSLTISIRMR